LPPPFNSAAIICRGLADFKYMPVRQNSVSNERNLERFMYYFGKSPEALAGLWDDLQSTQIEDARVKGTENMLYYNLMSSVYGGIFYFYQSHLVARGRI
jgi:hypothetical protein